MEQKTFADPQSQNSEHSPAVSPSNESYSAPVQEKMIPESEVNNRIRHATANVADKVRKELSIQQTYPSQTSQVAQPNTTAANGLTEEQIRQIAAETVQKEQQAILDKANQDAQMRAGYQIANEFKSKLESGKSNYSDFDDVVGALPFADMPHIVGLANTVENTADVMYELGNNPSKIANLTQLMHISPQLAQKEMQKLSQSIKLNQEAKHVKQANEPLSRLQPSPIDVGNGPRTVKDFRKIYR